MSGVAERLPPYHRALIQMLPRRRSQLDFTVYRVGSDVSNAHVDPNEISGGMALESISTTCNFYTLQVYCFRGGSATCAEMGRAVPRGHRLKETARRILYCRLMTGWGDGP